VIVVDSSIVVAVYRQEADAERCALGIASDDQPIMSAANVIETSIVLRGLKMMPPAEAEQWLDDFVATAGIRIEPVTVEQTRLARIAHRRFGKGTGHGAALNYGDCFAYALAKAMGVPLLCKGNGFRLTDITLA